MIKFYNPDIEEIIEDLRKEYTKAKEKSRVVTPALYALSQTYRNYFIKSDVKEAGKTE